MSSELRLPHVRISQRLLGEYPDVEVDGVLLNGVTEFEFKPPHRLTLVLEVGRLEAMREPLRPEPRDASADPEHIRASPAVGEGMLVQGSGLLPDTVTVVGTAGKAGLGGHREEGAVPSLRRNRPKGVSRD